MTVPPRPRNKKERKKNRPGAGIGPKSGTHGVTPIRSVRLTRTFRGQVSFFAYTDNQDVFTKYHRGAKTKRPESRCAVLNLVLPQSPSSDMRKHSAGQDSRSSKSIAVHPRSPKGTSIIWSGDRESGTCTRAHMPSLWGDSETAITNGFHTRNNVCEWFYPAVVPDQYFRPSQFKWRPQHQLLPKGSVV